MGKWMAGPAAVDNQLGAFAPMARGGGSLIAGATTLSRGPARPGTAP